ncbi:unnamed protein product [Heterosigma akashiwo]
MSRNCKDVAEQLVECMRQTKCMSEGGELKECLKINPDECMVERRGYFECKRALLDMRTRIRGRRLGVDNNNLEG